MSSSNRQGCWEGLIVGLGLEAVVEAAEEGVEQVALRGSVPIAGHTAPVVVGSGTRGEAQGGDGPEVADRGQALVLDVAAEPRPVSLSGAARQVLTIIAYRQPVSQAGIESVRDTSSDSPIGTLL